jgi:hypothetical protein
LIDVTDVLPIKRRWLWTPLLIVCAATLAVAGGNSSLQNQIAQLGSDNPQLRDEARVQLMGLPREDLPALRTAALAQSPLLPGQIAELRDVVTQVYLAGEDYNRDPSSPRGFLGLYWGTMPTPVPGQGILTVVNRIAGFPAYRMLKTGDIITQVVESPQAPIHGATDLTNVLQAMHCGDVVPLNILRSGRPLTVGVPLAIFPVDLDQHRADDAWIENWMLDRQQRADEYWARQFSAIDPAVSTTQPQTTAAQP